MNTRCRKLTEMTAGGIDETLHELGLYIKHGILRLQETWNEIGVTDTEQAEKCESVVSSLRSVLDSLVIGERAWRDCLEEECLQLSERCNEHSRILGIPHHFRVEEETEALLTRRDVLGRRNRELEQDIVRKKIEIEKLEERKISCIKRLGLQPDHYPCIQSDNINRVTSLLQLQIKEFEDDMEKRTKRLHTQLEELTELVDSLEIDRHELIGEGLIADDPDTLILSDEAIRRRYDMITKYRSEVNDNMSTSIDLKHQITRLNRLLLKEDSVHESISQHFDSPKPSSLQVLKRELSRLQQLKQEKLEAYVAGLREEIVNFQKLCFQTRCEVSSSSETALSRDHELKTSSTDTLDLPDIILDDIENKNHSNSNSNSNSNNLIFGSDKVDSEMSENGGRVGDCVPELEEELEIWESFYRSNYDVFELIRKWKELNDRFAELETPSPDKYNNRGGSLLQSQKEAAKISKEIPKIESKVLAEMDKTIGEEIRINGLSLEDYFLENRATTSLTRLNSLRRSRKKSGKGTRNSPSSEDSRIERTRSLREKSSPEARNCRLKSMSSPRSSVNVADSKSSIDSRNSYGPTATARRSMRKRVSREAGLDRVGLK
ncbi:hypothetical protein ACHWQZ_G001070 [Mnemiopsis leidyi]